MNYFRGLLPGRGKRRRKDGPLRTAYTDLMSRQFGSGTLPDGLEMDLILSETTFHTPDGGMYMNRTDAGNFARGRSATDILLDDDAGLPELQSMRDYGAALGTVEDCDELEAYGKMLYTLSCARALVLHDDPLTTYGRETQLKQVDIALNSNVVPRELIGTLLEAKKKLAR